MIDSDLLRMLRCPETQQTLDLAAPGLLEALNQRIVAGQLRNRGGQAVAEKIEGGLIRSDGKFLYPVRREIPIMLIDEAIPLTS